MLDMTRFLSKWPTLGQLGLKARRCTAEPDCRVKPVQIDGGPESDFSVTLFVEDGNILGVGVSDLDDLALAANVGETWDNVTEDEMCDFVPEFDFLSGEPLGTSGWTVTRRLDGDTKSFTSLTGIMSALNGGAFGLRLYSSDQFDAEPTCPEATCNGCPDPETCAGLRSAEVPSGAGLGPIWIDEFTGGMDVKLPRQENGEILGWNAPELS